MSDDLELADGGPWPAFADLLAATTLLFLVLFAVGALPAMRTVAQQGQVAMRIKTIKGALDKGASATGYEVHEYPTYLRVVIKGEATFPADSSDIRTLRPSGRLILDSLAAALNRSNSDSSIEAVQVAGHTSAEGSDEHNWLLSSARATSVALYLIRSGKLDVCMVSALGRGRYYPVSPEADRQVAHPEDRRIEIEIRPKGSSVAQTDAERKCVR